MKHIKKSSQKHTKTDNVFQKKSPINPCWNEILTVSVTIAIKLDLTSPV